MENLNLILEKMISRALFELVDFSKIQAISNVSVDVPRQHFSFKNAENPLVKVQEDNVQKIAEPGTKVQNILVQTINMDAPDKKNESEISKSGHSENRGNVSLTIMQAIDDEQNEARSQRSQTKGKIPRKTASKQSLDFSKEAAKHAA